MRFEIISIGDEILSGNILDTNKQFISDALWQNGFKVKYHTSVCDDEADISEALLNAAQRADVVICTGGLGPTADDFTIEVAAKTFCVNLVTDKPALKYLEDFFKKKGRALTSNNSRQALKFEGGKAFINTVGTAPGLYYQYKKRHFYFLPGVPREMKYLFNKFIIPELSKKRTDGLFLKKIFLKTFGCTESELDNRLKDLMHDRTHIENARIGFRFHFPEVILKISVWDKNEAAAEECLKTVVKKIRERVGEFIYAEDENATLEGVLVTKLKDQKKTIALAESCTGGLVADRITNIPGASEVFVGGVVAYSNALKNKILKVDQNILAEHGAVSSECAHAMVKGIKDLTSADCCVAITGIAGPAGGTDDKPVGTVYIAIMIGDKIDCQKHFFPFSREQFKLVVGSVAIKMVLARVCNAT